MVPCLSPSRTSSRRRADQALDQEISIAGCIAGIDRRIEEAGHDAAGRGLVARDIETVIEVEGFSIVADGVLENARKKHVAVEDIGAGTADQEVAPIAAHEDVVACVADQSVVRERAKYGFDPVIAVPGGASRIARGIGEIDRHAGGEIGLAVSVADDIDAVATLEAVTAVGGDEQVVAHAANEGVAAATTEEDVATHSADQRLADIDPPDNEIIQVGADHAFDADEGVSCGVAPYG